MRSAVLDLAFNGLGAVLARTGAFADNIASATVSQKLGYDEVAEHWPQVRGVPVRERLFELSRDQWASMNRPTVRISGLEPCLSLFGL